MRSTEIFPTQKATSGGQQMHGNSWNAHNSERLITWNTMTRQMAAYSRCLGDTIGHHWAARSPQQERQRDEVNTLQTKYYKKNGPFVRDLISLQVASPRKTSCPWQYSKFEFRARNLNGGTKIKPWGRKRDPHKRMQEVGKQSTTGMDVKSRSVGPEGGLGCLRWI